MFIQILTILTAVLFLNFSTSFAADKPEKKNKPVKKIETKNQAGKKHQPQHPATPPLPAAPTPPPSTALEPADVGSTGYQEEPKALEVSVKGTNLCIACELGALSGAKHNCEELGHFPVLRVSSLKDNTGLERPEFLGETLYYLPGEQTKLLLKRLKKAVAIKGKIYPRSHILEVIAFIEEGSQGEMPEVLAPIPEPGSAALPGSSPTTGSSPTVPPQKDTKTKGK